MRTNAAPVDVWSDDAPAIACPRDFQVLDQGEQYVLKLRDVPITFELRNVRYERHELFGRLTVRTTLSGARIYKGVLGAPSTLNLSSAAALSTRARLLHELARSPQIDWLRLLQEFAILVSEHQDHGDPATDLGIMPDPGDALDDALNYRGVQLPALHQSIVFGDGGVMKSYLALAMAAHFSEAGIRVGFLDWELYARDHRRRLPMICGNCPLPSILHVRCTRPLVHECERIRRVTRSEAVDFWFYDSAGFATNGAPESAEAALAYFQAASLIGIGGCHLAHITKNGDQNDQRPFGSNFWHHSARCTWNIKLESDESSERGRRKILGLFNRKNNLADLHKPVGLAVTFDRGRVIFSETDLRETKELVTSLKLSDRIAGVIKHQPMTLAVIAAEIGHKNVESLDRIVRRHKDLFTKVSGQDGVTRIALVERRES